MSKQDSKNGFKTLLLLMGLGALIGCTKPEDPQPQPQPTPPQNDSIPTTPVTPVKPYDTIYLRIKSGVNWAQYVDTVRNRLKPGVILVTIHVYGENGIGRPINATSWDPPNLSALRDIALKPMIDVDTIRTNLDGLIGVKQIGPAGYEPGPYEYGTMPYDVAQYLMTHNLRIVPNSKQH